MTNFDFFTNCKTIEDARKRYHQLAQVYHSDIDNGDAETMKLLNDQFAAWIGKDEAARADVPELPAGVLALPEHLPDAPSAEAVAAAEFMQVIGVLINLPGISCELCGSWVWISGDTKSVKDQLKDAGCKFASKKSMWYWAPAGSRGRRGRGSKDMAYIRNKYGSRAIRSNRDDD